MTCMLHRPERYRLHHRVGHVLFLRFTVAIFIVPQLTAYDTPDFRFTGYDTPDLYLTGYDTPDVYL